MGFNELPLFKNRYLTTLSAFDYFVHPATKEFHFGGNNANFAQLKVFSVQFLKNKDKEQSSPCWKRYHC
jgi:hypothetical protein